MGQYYSPVGLSPDGDPIWWLDGRNYNNSLKLMEQSYIGNDFVAVVEVLLKKQPTRLVWLGDYADDEELYDSLTDENKVKPTVQANPYATRFLVNFDKKEFVDKAKCPPELGSGEDEDGGEFGEFFVHPLPLLTCEGSGQGGGDYHKDNPFVGVWARDTIGVQSEKPEGFTEIVPNFD